MICYAAGFNHRVVKTEKKTTTNSSQTSVSKKKKKTTVTTTKPDGSKTISVVEEEVDEKTTKKAGTVKTKTEQKVVELNKYRIGVAAYYDWKEGDLDQAITASYRFYGPLWSDFHFHKNSKAVTAGISVEF